MSDEVEVALGKAVGPDRRTFLKRLILGTAFAAPVVASFTMTGVQSVFAASGASTTAQTTPNTSTPTTTPTAVAPANAAAQPSATEEPKFTG